MATAVTTGTTTTAPLREADIVAGAKTIILTLTGDTFVATGATFDAQRQNIINGLTSAQSEATGWNLVVKAGLAVGAVVRTSNTVCTITLSAFATYNITALDTVTITIPSTALIGAVAIVSAPAVQVIPAPWTFYIRKIGSDSNFGTTAAAAWLTLGKALGAAGISSGDTVWWGAGVYREGTLTVNMTSATAETKIYGDVDGSHTGDAGEVQFSGYNTNDVTAGNGSINLNGRDFLTFQDIFFMGANAIMITATVSVSTDIKFTRCLFVVGSTGANNLISHTTAANTAANWVIDSCQFITGGTNGILLTLTRPAGADFNYNIVIKNCIFGIGGGNCISITSTGANVFNGGGVDIRNCSNLSSGNICVTGANTSTTIPAANVYNCCHFSGGSALNANASGQIVENYNFFVGGATPRTNVTAGANSIAGGTYAPLFFTGHEYWSVGANLMPYGMPKPGSPLLGFGNQASSPTTDLLQAARPSGFVLGGKGTATAGAAKTLTDTNQTWGTNSFAGYTVKIISGTGSGQTKTIASNTATILTVDGNWKTNPDNTSVYEIYLRAMSSTGTATAGTTTTLTDANAAWGINMWAGYTLTIDTGTGSPQTLTVVSNTATALTFATATAPDNTSTYSLFRGTSVNVINAGVGCYEYGGSAIKETTTVRTGSNAIRIPGAGYNDFVIPVNATATTVTVYGRYDSAYSGTLPSLNIINGTECGVANATATCVGAANAFELLSLTFTPTAAGIITLRLLSRSTTPTGSAFFDDFAIT